MPPTRSPTAHALAETARLILIGSDFRPAHALHYRGLCDRVSIEWREAVQQALGRGTPFLWLEHEHPSGVALPSVQDIATTRMLCRALRPLGLRLIDHVITAGADRFSFRDEGLL